MEYTLRATFSRSAIQQHETNATRAATARAAELQKERALNDECKNVVTYRDALKILIREALGQYKLGKVAMAHIPLHVHATDVNAYELGRGSHFFNVSAELGESLKQQLSQILDTLVDCQYELSASIGYEEGGERGDEYEPTTVSLTLIPTI